MRFFKQAMSPPASCRFVKRLFWHSSKSLRRCCAVSQHSSALEENTPPMAYTLMAYTLMVYTLMAYTLLRDKKRRLFIVFPHPLVINVIVDSLRNEFWKLTSKNRQRSMAALWKAGDKIHILASWTRCAIPAPLFRERVCVRSELHALWCAQRFTVGARDRGGPITTACAIVLCAFAFVLACHVKCT